MSEIEFSDIQDDINKCLTAWGFGKEWTLFNYFVWFPCNAIISGGNLKTGKTMPGVLITNDNTLESKYFMLSHIFPDIDWKTLCYKQFKKINLPEDKEKVKKEVKKLAFFKRGKVFR